MKKRRAPPSSGGRPDRLAIFDVRALREISAIFRNKSTLMDLFHIYMLTLMGRLKIGRAAVYVPTPDPRKFRFFLRKGKGTGDAPETIMMNRPPVDRTWVDLNDLTAGQDAGPFGQDIVTCVHTLAWRNSASSERPAKQPGETPRVLIFVATSKPFTLSAAAAQFIDLLGRQAEETLERHMGDVGKRLLDLERRTDLIKDEGIGRPQSAISRATLLDSRNLQTLQDIAFRFKSGVSLHDLFNTYLLTLMGRLRLKRTVIYVATLPSTRFNRFLSKGREERGSLPDFIDVPRAPTERLWVEVEGHRDLNRGNVFCRCGYSLAWILAREISAAPASEKIKVDAIVYMGRDESIRLSAADIKFIEILNNQISGIMNMLEGLNQSGRRTLWNWDANLADLMQENGSLPAVSMGDDRTRLRVIYRPAHKVGGDFYDFYELAGGATGIVLADVVGHGIPAAIWTYAIRAQLKKIAIAEDEAGRRNPAAVLEKLNAELLKNNRGEIPVSVFYGIFDASDGSFAYASAGMDYPVLLRAQDSEFYDLPAGGLFLGCIPGIRLSQETVFVWPGDLLVIHSDGCQNAMDSKWRESILARRGAGDAHGAKRQGAQLIDFAHELLQNAIDAELREDDCTAIFLSPAAAPAADRLDVRRLTIPADVRHLQTLRVFMDNVIRQIGEMSAEDVFAVGFTAEDAVVNSIQHGYAGMADGTVTVESRPDPGGITITVADTGRGFLYDPGKGPQFVSEDDLYRSNGRGLFMMRQLMDEVHVDSTPAQGTTVRLVKHFGRGADHAA